ncbi:prepilin-type N-terminal cleavage/methylation domain-containing protein [Verminephrobacter aporrectodeae]|uniref:prepilin-type N-terminal cleavage/methylation domain-containing protein n=1 Tax=Verminephrobacter aporrectodeae TaxID=1110389 RepID=UPI0022437CC2|nr:prepilin-type N-terminal cleavage/methylation domain-containing protein [Verminephrobacter aporrectodeae]MCW8175663.1 type II secretion system protein GspH [Verminephrobacter aporrectodeae subsp. tuberculatae]MCW8203248.1 type II secretion system protein GspH [Verminephrobacter aporrectodeae subsp. tuberculatae]
MPTLAAGNSRPRRARARGFTLLELLVVVSIMALATAGVGLALRDSGQTLLEREADRLAALLESARAQSRAMGLAVRWRALPQGFRFEGLPPAAQAALPSQWLDAGTVVRGPGVLQLGPEPLIGPQQLLITHLSAPGRSLRIATDGVRPFSVDPAP